MINQGFNLTDYQRNQYLAQQAMQQNQMMQMQQMGQHKNLYSIIEVSSNEEIRRIKIDPNITYIFLNENSDRIFIRQLSGNTVETLTYAFSQNDGDEFLDPVARLERRMENFEKLLGGLANVQPQSSNAVAEKACAEARNELRDVKDKPVEEAKSAGVQRGGGSHQRKN